MLEALFLGIIQGITEFLPISSSGHLIIFQNLLGFKIDESQIFFDLILHLGTLLAIIIVLNKQILSFIKSKFFLLLIMISFIMTSIIGLILSNFKESFISIKAVGIALFFNAIILFCAENYPKKFTYFIRNFNFSNETKINIPIAILIGLMQGIAVLPGISRSGATIGIALFLGVIKEQAFTYSFILAIPTLIAATLYEFVSNYNLIKIPEMSVFFTGFFSSFLIGIISLILLKKLVLKSKLYYFAIYCLIVSVIILFRVF